MRPYLRAAFDPLARTNAISFASEDGCAYASQPSAVIKLELSDLPEEWRLMPDPALPLSLRFMRAQPPLVAEAD